MSTGAANINDVFFGGMYKDVWRKLIPAGLSEAEVDFIIDVASLHKGDTVLDIMCGYGRHAIGLAQKGIDVTAVDNLADYVDEVKAVADKEGLPIKTIHSGALQFSTTEQFRAIICMGNSFAFFDRQQTAQFIMQMAACLQRGGCLIINSWMIAEIALKHFKEREWLKVDAYKYMLDYQYKFDPSRIESEHTLLHDDGRVELIKGIDYIFTLDELETMFLAAGVKTKARYSTPRKKNFALGNSTIYMVVEKL